MKQIFTIILQLLAIAAVAQNRVYLSSQAPCGGNGSQSSPFNCFEAALSHAMGLKGADSTIIEVSEGVYPLEKSIKITSSPASPIVVRGLSESMPIISGAIPVEGWSITAEGLWRAEIPEVARYGLKVEQLYVNGKRAIRAKTPDKGWFFLQSSQESILYGDEGRMAVHAAQKLYTDPKNLESLDGLTPSEIKQVTAMFYHKWDNTRKYLDFAKPDSGLLCISGRGMKQWNTLNSDTRFTLENYPGALTMAGEWYMDNSGVILYIPREGEKIEEIKAYAPVLEKLIEITGTEKKAIEGISFENISFCHTAYHLAKSGCEPEQAAASVSAAIELNYANNIGFTNCQIKHTAGYAIWFKRLCRGGHLIHSYLYDLGAGGVKIGEPILRDQGKSEVTNNIIIDNNIIQSAGHLLPCGVGIAVLHASDNKVTHNDIGDILYSGISVGWTWGYNSDGPTEKSKGPRRSPALNNEIAYNHVHHIGWGELSDMGAVYTLGQSDGTHIHGNHIHDIYTFSYGGWGLYADEGSGNIIMENNLVYGSKSGGYHQHYGKDNIIRNNIFAFSHLQQLRYTRVEEHRSFTFTGNIVVVDHGKIIDGDWDKGIIDMDKNLYWDMRGEDKVMFNDYTPKEWKKIKDANSVIADPSFKDPYKGDYTFTNKKSYKKIDFTPFDYSKAGVYGCPEWVEKATIPQERIDRFSEIVREAEESYSHIYDK